MTPTRTTLYRLYDDAGSLLYVGISDRYARRLTEHAADKSWWPEVKSATLTWYDSRPEASRAERAAVCAEKPRHNELLTHEDYSVILSTKVAEATAAALEARCRELGISASEGLRQALNAWLAERAQRKAAS